MPTPIPNTQAVVGLLAPTNFEDIFPAYDFRYGLGGFRTVGTTTDLLLPTGAGEAVNPSTPDRSITSRRRKKGMVAYVEGVTAFYGLFSSTADSAWEVVGPSYFKGGIRSLATTAQMDAIAGDMREEGMIVYVRGVTAYYALIGTTANAGWTTGFTFGKGGGAGDVTAAGANVFTNLNTFNAGITTSWIYASTGSTFGGTILVSGGATLASRVDIGGVLDVVGGVTFESTTDHAGVARFASGVTASGRVDIGGVLDVVGGVTFESTSDHAGVARFAAGITTSTIDVTNLAKFNGNVTVGDGASDVLTVNSGATFGITDHSGAARFASTVTTTGILTANGGITASTIDVTNLAKFNGNVTVGDGATDVLTVNAGATLASRVDIGGVLDVVGGVTFESTSDHAGVARFAAGITSSTLDVTNLAKFNGNVTVGDNAADVLTVNSGATFGITDHSGAARFASTVTTTGILTANGGITASTLDVTNLAKFNGNVTVGDAASDVLTVTSGATFGITDHSGAARFASTVTTTGILTANGGITASAIDVTGLAKFNGNVTVGDAASDVLTVTSGATFGITDHSGIARFAAGITSSTLDVTNLAKFNGNVTIGDAASDVLTVTSGATFGITDHSGAARFASTLTTTGILTANGGITASTVDVTGLAKFNGNVTVGDAASDVLTVTSGATFGTTDFSSPARFNNSVTIKGSAANTTFDTVGNVTVGATLTVNGNFFVAGTVTTVNRTDLQVDDKTILLGRTLANDTLADGGGIVLASGLTASITWSNAQKAWTTNQSWDIAGSTYAYKIAGVTALASTFLGSAITGSSLAGVGTITSGRWRGSIVELAHGGASADLSGEATNGIVYKAANNLAVTVAGTNTQVLSANGSGVPTWANLTALTGITATSVNINSSGDSGTYFLAFLNSSSTGARLVYTDAGITFDANSNTLSCTKIEAIVDGGVWT